MATTTSKVGQRAWTLLDLDVQGRVYRFTDAPETQRVTDAAGTTYAYTPGLSPMTLERRVEAPTTSIGVTINAQQEVSWAKMVERGHSIDRAKVIVRRWYVGQVLDVADTYLRGVVVDPAWGNSTEPLTFTVQRLRRESGVIPTDDMLITTKTWPVTSTFTTDDAALGSWYPMVYGAPSAALTPGYLVEFKAADLANSKLLIAGHRVAATTVTLHDVQGNQSGTTAVLTTTDLLGRTVSYVDFNTVTFAPEEGREYRIAWDQGTAGAGQGYIEAGAGLDGMGEILSHLLKVWSDMDLDDGRFAAAKSSLDEYRLAFTIVGQVNVWDWVEDILSLAPCEWTESANGEYPALWKIDATRSDAVGHIDCTRVTGRYTRVGGIVSDGSKIANRLTLQYGVGGSQSRPQKSVTVGSGLNQFGEFSIADGTIPNAFCALSERLYGRRSAPAVQTEIIDDPTTAGLIVRMWALLFALPRRSLQVSGDLSLDELPLNGVVTVTATDCNITNALGLVRGKRPDGDQMTIDVLLLDNPLTKARATT